MLASKFFLSKLDDLDAVLSTDLGEQRCFKFLIRQFVSLNKTKIINSVADRKWFVACGFWCEDLACDWLQHNNHSRHILCLHNNIIRAVNWFKKIKPKINSNHKTWLLR